MKSPLTTFRRFTGDHDEAQAIRRFEQLYGVRPQRVERVTAGCCKYLDLGPVPLDRAATISTDMEARR